MDITYLGHAGFLIESDQNLLLIDPWLNPDGAFSKSWYQFPDNHFLFNEINDYFSKSQKAKYIYISHEHKDHFDEYFLNSLRDKEFNFIIPKYKSKTFKRDILKIQCNKIIECLDSVELMINDMSIRLFIDDTGINRDSAIGIKSNDYTFLNMNDCKIYERADEIKSYYDVINVSAVQFSGATWYPICFDFDESEKQKLMLDKKNKKFQLVLNFLNIINSNYYIPSAGPPCFLADELKYINFIKNSQFPRSDEFIDFLNESDTNCNVLSMNPGSKFIFKSEKLVGSNISIDKNFEKYINDYSNKYLNTYRSNNINFKELCNELILENTKKLKIFKNLSLEEPYPLYFIINEYDLHMVKIDFNIKKVELINSESYTFGNQYYKVNAPGWLYKKILNREISWADFSLTFRLKIIRNPNIYSSFVQGFILSEIKDCRFLLDMIMQLKSNEEKIIISNNNVNYQIDRYCPHMGADLKDCNIIDDKYVICPRHGWKFDITNNGKCIESHDATINAIKVNSPNKCKKVDKNEL